MNPFAVFLYLLVYFTVTISRPIEVLNTHTSVFDGKDCDGSFNTLILGSGIIGLSTAYYLAKQNSSVCIFVVDPSFDVPAGASRHATGILHFGDLGPEVDPLSELSWKLHKELALKHNGPDLYGWRNITAYNITINKDGGGKLANDSPASQLPPWFKNSENYAVEVEPFNTAAARIDSARFCEFLYHQCKAMDVQFLLGAKVTGIGFDRSQPNLTTIHLSDQRSLKFWNCTDIVISAGAWSRNVIEDLFNVTGVIQMDTRTSSSNYLVVRNPQWRPSHDKKGCHQLFVGDVVGRPLDVTSQPGGTLYIGGYGADPAELPALPADVKPQEKAVNDMKKLCERILNIPEGQGLEVVTAGRGYRPLIKGRSGRPIIGEVDLSLLFNPSESGSIRHVRLISGHGAYGITLGPGTGLVTSELILGKEPSANISGLERQ